MSIKLHPPFFIFLVFMVTGLLSACSSTSSPPTPPPNLSPQAQLGFDLFTVHCAACHSTAPETIIVGPSLEGIATNAANRVPGQTADQYLYQSIINPYDFIVEGYSETMPPDFGKRLTGEEFDAIIVYLLTLTDQGS